MKENLSLVKTLNNVLACLLIGCLSLSASSQPDKSQLNFDRLSKKHQAQVDSLLAKLEPVIKKKEADGTSPMLAFIELYAPLNGDEITLMETVRMIPYKDLGKTSPYLGTPEPTDAVRVDGQVFVKEGKETTIPPQYVPKEVYEQYLKMNEQMKKDLGKNLLIESGYRSPAYQLYLFFFYMKKRNYSIMDTSKWNALPGYSEHGYPPRQALDFINQEGINGEDNPEDFAALPEYDWLVKNAKTYGFYLSYPKTNPTGLGYEPWHWHYEKKDVASGISS